MTSARPNSIRKLGSEVIDQIAAGEVVDRPAHMMKELCENSIDAGATEITIDFKNGGRDLTITDNGHGIYSADLPLALSRHATSKISAADDLWSISSYGFRGEALASIAAVSRLQMTSRPVDSELGSSVEADFGKLSEVQSVGSDYGTSIVIRDLYQNVPARLKFLKTDAGEAAAIKNQVKALALVNPSVQLRILYDGKLIYFWPATKNLKERVKQVLEMFEMYEGYAELQGYRASVVVASPNETVKNSRQIWVFVRNRFIQDRSLQVAVLEAYRNLLMHGEYPVAVINLDCDPNDVDVNVSPTKSQVKFKDPGLAFRAVQRAVRGVLETSPWVKDLLSSTSSDYGRTANSIADAKPRDENAAKSNEYNLSFSNPELSRLTYSRMSSSEKFSLDNVKKSLATIDAAPAVLENMSSLPAAVSVTQSQSNASDPWGNWARLDILGQAHLTYIIVQKEDAILFIDQHAAHERVMFEKLMKGYSGGVVEVQNFLLPMTARFAEDIVEKVLSVRVELEQLGLIVERLGPEELAITGAPMILRSEAVLPMLEKLAEELNDYGESFQIEKTIAQLIATMACHSAVRAGKAMTYVEIKSLLEQMDEFPLSSFCPHGRPVYVEYPIKKLERDFGRIV